jgi:hypothetical protein
MEGGKAVKRGVPQGGVVSPLLANLYMNRFLKHWRVTRRGEAFRAFVVSYADDFVILSRGCAAEALAWTKAVMTKLGLTLNEAKTSVKNARQERFDFLGYTFGPHRDGQDGQWYPGASPSKKSVLRIKARIGDLLRPGDHGPWPEVRGRLNRLLTGWSAYFGYGARVGLSGGRQPCPRPRPALPRSTAQGARARRPTVLPCGSVREPRRAASLPRAAHTAAVCLTMKSVGKPDALIGHVRFDERGRETGPLAMPQRNRALPRLYPRWTLTTFKLGVGDHEADVFITPAATYRRKIPGRHRACCARRVHQE